MAQEELARLEAEEKRSLSKSSAASFPQTRPIPATPSSKSARALADPNRPCLPRTFTGCTRATPKRAAGGWRRWIPALQTWADFKEIIFSVTGTDVYKRLKYESGVHRVQRVPATEAQGRIHTSTATVAVLPEAQEVDVDIRPDDLDISVCRASGPGGQGVNTTDSAVQIIHKPTG